MKKFRWQILIILVTLVVVTVLLLTRQSLGNTAAIQPASGGIYTEALVGSFGRLNPLIDLNNSADRDVDRLLFSSLFQFDSQGNPVPDLAESWGVSADGTIYNITIRADAEWSDGTPVTSDDVLFTLSLLRSQYSAYPADIRSMWDAVQITRIDDKNIKFTLPEPFAPFIDYLNFGILPKHLLTNLPADQLANTPFDLGPIGSGPYKLDHLIINGATVTGLVLTRSDTYYGKKPFIDQVVFRYYPESSSALQAYEQGEVLGISEIPADSLSAAMQLPNLALYSSRMPRLTLVLFNLNNNALPFFQDVNVRQALMLALNRQLMIDQALDGQGMIANSVILPDTWAYDNNLQTIGFDPDTAASMLDAEGYTIPANGSVRANKGNVSMKFTLLYPDNPLDQQIAEMIQSNWAAVGIQAVLKPVSYADLLSKYLTPRSYDAALVDFDYSRSYDPDPYPFWHQAEATGGQNYSQWNDQTASEYLEEARVTADESVRARLYRNFQVVFSEQLPALPLFYPVYTYGVDKRVLGVNASPLFEPADRFNDISSWYLVTGRSLSPSTQQTATP
jgi:peptide/nickel transport system substrate-binding protein